MASSTGEVFSYFCYSCQHAYDPDDEDVGMPKMDLWGDYKNPKCPGCGERLETVYKERRKIEKIPMTVHSARREAGVEGLEAKIETFEDKPIFSEKFGMELTYEEMSAAEIFLNSKNCLKDTPID